MKLSVVIPVFNEAATIRDVIRNVQNSPYEKEIIVVDDGSTDDTREILSTLDEANVRVMRHERNQGKGAALRTAFEVVNGDFVVIQDADLEYDPRDYPTLLGPLLDGSADVVYGSRFLGSPRRVLLFWHTVANGLLTLLSNMTTNLNLTDMETGYKAFRVDVVRRLKLRSMRFGVEPEITAKVARLGCRIYEVPISYRGRTYAEGKKINWTDGLRAVATILRYAVLPDQASGHVGYDTLSTIDGLDRYNDWLLSKITPSLGKRIFEAGCGTGTFTRYFARRGRVLAVDFDRHYITALREHYAGRSNIRVEWLDLCSQEWTVVGNDRFDTVVCMNVLEHLPLDAEVLGHFRDILDPGGRLIMLVPAHSSLFGTLDTALGHFRRYETQPLRCTLERMGLIVEKIEYINPTGAVGWFLNSRILKRETMPPVQAALYDRIYPVLRLGEVLKLPFGLSVFVVAQKPTTRADQNPDGLFELERSRRLDRSTAVTMNSRPG